MIWANLTRKAFEIACQAHAGQVDKNGVPYILHPLAVAEMLPDITTQAVALLHDVCENSAITPEDLLREDIPEEIVEAVKLLTHTPDDGMTYLQYIGNLKQNEIAAAVKRADLSHNMSPNRAPSVPSARYLDRQRRYHKALEILNRT